MDTQALTLIGAVIAIVGSLLGAVLAIDQLTASYRYRRRAEFLRATLASDELLPTQREILRSVHGETVGRFLAASAVPTWGLWSDLVLILLPGALSYLLGGSYLGLHRVMTAEFLSGLWLVGPIAFAFCWWGMRHGLFVLRERARLTRAYRRGRRMLRANGLMGNPFRDQRGVWLATVLTFGFLAAAAGTGATFSSQEAELPTGILFIAGFSLIFGFGNDVKRYVDPRPISWIHPEPKRPWPKRGLRIRYRFWFKFTPKSWWVQAPAVPARRADEPETPGPGE